jgi:hypothetical protein
MVRAYRAVAELVRVAKKGNLTGYRDYATSSLTLIGK